GKYKKDEVDIHFINRWHLQKRDPSLQISPPVEPIKFYIEHTTPVRYRRWVKQGVLFWNEAFEKVGISDAIEVVYQDKSTKENMEKDPEDVRYNFVRWLNNNEGTAIGPSRVHPETGQILDADIILTDGWIRHYNENFADYMPLLAMEGMGPETLAWLGDHPAWDPRVRFAEPSQRQQVLTQLRTKQAAHAAGLDATDWSTKLMGDNPLDGLVGRTSQVNGLCLAATGRKLDTSIMRMMIAMGPDALLDDAEEKEKEKKEGEVKDAQAKTGELADASAEGKKADEKQADKKPEAKKPEESMLDGMPESFIGPLIADLVAHEVGHTLGLRHNFKASSIYSLKQINSTEVKDRKALAGSVMDYLPINLRIKEGDEQGNYTMIDLGPYDYWAIEYGYTFEKDLSKILSRVSEPELQFATDEDTTGPDPLARRYDFSADPLSFAQEQALLIERFRKKLMTDYVKDGDSWTRAREGFELTLNLQMKNTSMMANWVGSSHINRDKKGDPQERLPIEVVSAERQREALKFVLESTFRDAAYALSPELLARLTKDFMSGFGGGDPAWPVHDRILSMQASALTMLMNATTLRRVYDNEFRIPSDQDAFALPELLGSISKEIWSELDSDLSKEFSSRTPMISSLRRNLQREHLDRLIDLTMPNNGSSAAYKAISNLCVMELHDLKQSIDQDLEAGEKSLDPYTKAHLFEASQRIGKALDAEYIYNQPSPNSFGIPLLLFGEQAKPPAGSDSP
ncbi:MAG: zinc-dependent metalloprotease, partial [Aureliella sp.]